MYPGKIQFRLPPLKALSGAVLQHASNRLEDLLRLESPMTFKIGWTHCPFWRWGNKIYGYTKAIEKWSTMVVVYMAPEPYSPSMLEAALIDKYKRNLFAATYIFNLRLVDKPLCLLYIRGCGGLKSLGFSRFSITAHQGTVGCKNERAGGDTCQGQASDGQLYMTYIVYRSFKVPPPVKPLEKKGVMQWCACVNNPNGVWSMSGVCKNVLNLKLVFAIVDTYFSGNGIEKLQTWLADWKLLNLFACYRFFWAATHVCTKASCAATVRSARGFVQDVGAEAASRSSGLLQLANFSLSNAVRDCSKLMVDKFELGLPIKETRLKSGDISVPILKLRDWLDFLIHGNHTHILCGLLKPDWRRERAILKAFWSNFRIQCPEHPIFEQSRLGNLQLEQTFPTLLHGDEGRGRRRTAFFCMNWHSVLGRGLRAKHAKHKARAGKFIKMKPNYHGHTLTSRFLVAAVPKVLYTGEHGDFWHTLLETAAEEANDLFVSGIEDQKTQRGKFNAVMLHVCGDWPWLVDSGYLKRSYRNVQRHKDKDPANPKPRVGVCHLCKAGQKDVDFEQINSEQPAWLQTMFSQEHDLFWDASEPSPFLNAPHPPNKLGSLWAFDVFHTMHLGICKCYLGSFLAGLSELECEGSVDARFEKLSEKYLQWCKSNHKRAHATKLTKELIQWQSTTMFPNGSWHKGGLTSTLMDWAQWLFETEGDGWPAMLQEAGAAAVACNEFLRILFDGDAWLPSKDAQAAGRRAMDFLRLYAGLARAAHLQRRALWILQPKFHCLHHIALGLLNSSTRGKTLNPICMSAQQDEDFIGRPSRLARRVTAQTQKVCERVLGRYRQSAYAKWVQAGYIIRPKPVRW